MTEFADIRELSPTITTLLSWGESVLTRHGVPNARRNTDWLMADVLACRAGDLYLDSDLVLQAGDVETFGNLVDRRAAREPLQYVLESTEFMSLPFIVRRGVFVPRPDTEVLVEAAEARLRSRQGDLQILDLCCGSGVIAVSLARRLQRTFAVAVDISDEAVALTRRNAELNSTEDNIRCVISDAHEFLTANDILFDAIVCNPPYVPTKQIESLAPEIRLHEPILSLDGGEDGADFYRRVVPLFATSMKAGGIIVLEIDSTIGSIVSGLLRDASFQSVEIYPDYGGLDRLVIAQRQSSSGGV